MTVLKMDFSLMILKWLMKSAISKKGDSFKKENYRPVSILPHMLKFFERILYKQTRRNEKNSRVATNYEMVADKENFHFKLSKKARKT